MFQTYEVRTSPAQGAQNLPLLRGQIDVLELDGFIVPHEDEFQNEYIPPAFDRLCWLTGFTGSAGAALVLKQTAALFVDSRYTLQAAAQTDTDLFEQQDFKPGALAEWLLENVTPGGRIGYDPWLHTVDAINALTRRLSKKEIQLIPVSPNPVDTVWTGRPAPPAGEIVPHPDEMAGQPSTEKRRAIAEQLTDAGADAALITSPASVAWLLNIRGQDVAHTPLALARVLLLADGTADFFTFSPNHANDLSDHLGSDIRLRPITELDAALKQLKDKTIIVDPGSAPAAIFNLLEETGANPLRTADPCVLPKAIKNTAEANGARAAHVRDGQALSRFLHWLSIEAPKSGVTEIDAAKQLEIFRQQTNALKDVSFETISGAGSNGAIVHYRVTTETNKALEMGSLYLVDSGGQYLDGTTDVTRTVAIGEPTSEMVRAFTLVLKGHIALATARFPKGTTGAHLDALARMALWKAGLDFDHGTGHGVGSYLGVHEGPQNISKAMRNVPLEPGMILSNEPGYYTPGKFGIRIENLILVTGPAIPAGGEREMLGFETLTLAPIDRSLILPDLLAQEERDWLNAYHARVYETVAPSMSGDERNWLQAATQPI